MNSRHSFTMSINGSGVSRLAQLAASVPRGPRRAVITAPRVLCPAAGAARGFSHVALGDTCSISCRYSMGPRGERHGAGIQFVSDPSGLIGSNVPPEDPCGDAGVMVTAAALRAA